MVRALRLCERQALLDTSHHGLMDLADFAKVAFPLCIFAGSEVAQPWFASKDLARGGHFEPSRN